MHYSRKKIKFLLLIWYSFSDFDFQYSYEYVLGSYTIHLLMVSLIIYRIWREKKPLGVVSERGITCNYWIWHNLLIPAISEVHQVLDGSQGDKSRNNLPMHFCEQQKML